MSRQKFIPKEMEVLKMHHIGASEMLYHMGMVDFPREEPLYNRPISCTENFKMMLEGERPYWVPNGGYTFCDVNVFRPRIHPDNVATRLISDAEPLYQYRDGFTVRSSWFDLDWVFVPVAGGATIKPGTPRVPSMAEWEKYISMPNLDDLDWESCFSANREFLDTNQMNQLGILSGFWERLVSLMDAAGAAMALIDEDEQEGVHRFFDRYADLLISYIDRMSSNLRIDCVLIHDDWGHQNGPFFSLDTAMEMLVPYLKRVIDFIHSKGMLFEMHSCGKNEALVPAYISAGVDIWNPQPINDLEMLAKTYQDDPIIFTAPDVMIDPSASEEEIQKIAEDWYKKYKDYRVGTGFMMPNPVFMKHLYILSRMDSDRCSDC